MESCAPDSSDAVNETTMRDTTTTCTPSLSAAEQRVQQTQMLHPDDRREVWGRMYRRACHDNDLDLIMALPLGELSMVTIKGGIHDPCLVRPDIVGHVIQQLAWFDQTSIMRECRRAIVARAPIFLAVFLEHTSSIGVPQSAVDDMMQTAYANRSYDCAGVIIADSRYTSRVTSGKILLAACDTNTYRAIKELMDHTQITPPTYCLTHAIARGYAETVRALLDCGCPVTHGWRNTKYRSNQKEPTCYGPMTICVTAEAIYQMGKALVACEERRTDKKEDEQMV